MVDQIGLIILYSVVSKPLKESGQKVNTVMKEIIVLSIIGLLALAACIVIWTMIFPSDKEEHEPYRKDHSKGYYDDK